MDKNCLQKQNLASNEPILFNPIKHHTGAIKQIIGETTNEEDLLRTLLTIGESQMDLYVGELSVGEITQQIIKQLKQKNVITQTEYSEWINSGGSDYKMLTLSDNSQWTLRLSNDNEKYIHIHPGRYSPRTMRIKANTLKTAIAVNVYAKVNKYNPLDLEIINYARKEILGESPIKSISTNSGLGKIIALFNFVRHK